MKYTTVGLDIAKNVFQLHWVDAGTSYCQIWCFGFGMIRRPAVAEPVCCRSPVARL
jgi:hypothetical protein